MRFTLSVFLILINFPVLAQKDWKLKRDDDGIQIYTAETPNSNFKSVKVTCTVDATLTQLAAFLLDVGQKPPWVYNSENTRVLTRVAPNELIFYSQVKLPWPCQNRDYVAHFVIRQTGSGHMVLDSHIEPGILPVTDGFVRVMKSSSTWDVVALSATRLQLTYTVQFDPGGSVPAWLVNMFVTKGPYETFENLRSRIKDAKYAQAHLDFIKQ